MENKKGTLVRLSIPPRLRSGCLMKEAFDIPNSPEGASFLNWWDSAKTKDRDALMKLALDNNITMLEAQNKKESTEEEIA